MTDAKRLSLARGQPSIEDWRRLARKSLKDEDFLALTSCTRDGIAVEPLYERRRDAAPLSGRGARAWIVVQVVDDADPDEANRQAQADLEGGATGLSLRFAGASSAAGAGLPVGAAALRVALDGVDIAKTHLRLEPGADGPAGARWLRDVVEASGVAPELTSVAFGLDPVAALAGQRAIPRDDAPEFAACIRELTAAHFRGPFVTLDGRIFHETGATEAQELAAVLAAAAWWLRLLDDAGTAPLDSLPFLGVSLSVDRDQFLSIAKLRALRLLWARLAEFCEAEPQPLSIHAETSRRMLTRADPSTNLLRTTLAAFAAGIAGADSVTVLPHTAALGHPDQDARALARNIQHLLMDEAHLHRVADPGGGSGAIEALSEALAARAWAEFQIIEREGGIVASLVAGAFQARIANARAALEQEVASGDLPLIGATVYPARGETAPWAPPTPRDDALARLGLARISLEEFAEAAA
jgi:methylmalonyl-CoA mutase